MQGALGNGLPRRDLLVSRQHRMLVRSSIAGRMFGDKEVLVAAHHLTALPGVTSQFGPFIDGARAQDSFEVTSNLAGRTEVDRLQLSLHLDHEFSCGLFKSITSASKRALRSINCSLSNF